MIRHIVPKQGAIKGIQYFTITRSGLALLISLPTEYQFSGFIELILTLTGIPSGGGPAESCVFPGNKKEGYCRLKV
jgi:hypothetical protein